MGAGPYIGYGIGGTTKQKLNSGSWSDGATEEKWKTFGDGVFDESRNWLHGTTLKRLDAGVGANIDFGYRKLMVGIGYEHGLRNIAVQKNNNGQQYKNKTLQVSVGYKL